MKNHALTALLVLASPLALAACSETASTSAVTLAQDGVDYRTERLNLIEALKADPGNVETRARYVEVLLTLGDGVGARSALEALTEAQLEEPHISGLMAHAHLLESNAEQAIAWSQSKRAADAKPAWVYVTALLAEGRDTEALAAMDEAMDAFPKNPELMVLRGDIALQQRRPQQARELAAEALAQDENHLGAHMLAGRVDLLRQNFAAARDHFAAAASHHGGLFGPILSLAATEADLGNREAAEEQLQKLLAIAPNHPIGLFLSAKLAFVEGDLGTAHQLMQQAERDLRRVPAAQLLLGEIAHLRGNHEQAISYLRGFLKEMPDHVHASTVMGQAYMAVGEPANAWKVVQGPASRAQASPQLLALAAKLAEQQGETDIYSARIAERALPQDAGQRLAQADRALAAREWGKAAKIYADLRADGMGQSVLVLNNAAIAELEAGNGASALKLAREAHALTPGDPQVEDTLGWVLLKSGGDKAEALRLLASAKKTLPGNLEIRWHYANALAENGQRAEARRMVAEIRDFAGEGQQERFDRLLASL